AAQPAGVVLRHVQPVELVHQLGAVPLQPVDERDDGHCVVPGRETTAALLDPAVPGTHVLADVTPVHARAQVVPEAVWDRMWRLRPVGEAETGAEHARLDDRVGRARVDAQPARAAVLLERPARLDVDLRYQRSQYDPGAVTLRA